MNGTVWTEPGRGATAEELLKAIPLTMDGALAISKIGDRHIALANVIGSKAALEMRTNLRLTGEPLTAEDLKRIEQAEVTR